jgi:transcriptional regulator with PAS, ATPase and Fis domain
MTLPRSARPADVFPRPPAALDGDHASPGLTLLERGQPAQEQLLVLGASTELRRALETARRVAPTDASVFITGESGTGKELVAQFIHFHSLRRRGRFVPVNCAALPEGLFESELFGHRRGAFTGAVREKPGILETAHAGTMFLDELAEMPTSVQAKLLRVLQDGVVRRVGSELPDAEVDVRLIAATNRDPSLAVQDGALREDLFYRVHVVPIHLPPLRERPDDIRPLAEHFLASFWARHRGTSSPCPHLTPEAQWALAAHPWRGNVRELQNTIEHLVVLAEPAGPIGPAQIPFRREAPCAAAGNIPAAAAGTTGVETGFERGYRAARRSVVDAFESHYLTWFVRRAGRNFSKAARIAGIDRTTLYRLLDRHGLERPRLPDD